jgi:uncharacterized membrane-anchored protein YhcB (DUF1043 family)
MISLDDQFKYDFTDWNILLLFLFVSCVLIGYLINRLMKQAEQEQQQDEALDFLVRQAEHYDLYNLKNITKESKDV